MKIVVSNKIYIYDAPASFIRVLKKATTLPNPVYTDMLRRVKFNPKFQRAIYGLKKDFKYHEYDKDTNIFNCGRGNLQRIINYVKKNGNNIRPNK